jgi:hypothetical protein
METRSMNQTMRTMAPISTLLSIILAQAVVASPNPVINSYFPLHDSNRWVYVQASTDQGFTHGTAALRKAEEVRVAAAYDGDLGRIFKVSNYTFGLGADLIEFLGGDQSLNGPVVEVMGGHSAAWYRFGIGNPVEIPAFGNDCVRGSKGAMMRLVDKDTPAGRFKDCIEIVYSAIPCMDLGLASEVFAPGIGLVERTLRTAGGGLETWQLKYADVNGETFPARTQQAGGASDHQAAAAPPQTAPSTWGQIKATLATR